MTTSPSISTWMTKIGLVSQVVDVDRDDDDDNYDDDDAATATW